MAPRRVIDSAPHRAGTRETRLAGERFTLVLQDILDSQETSVRLPPASGGHLAPGVRLGVAANVRLPPASGGHLASDVRLGVAANVRLPPASGGHLAPGVRLGVAANVRLPPASGGHLASPRKTCAEHYCSPLPSHLAFPLFRTERRDADRRAKGLNTGQDFARIVPQNGEARRVIASAP